MFHILKKFCSRFSKTFHRCLANVNPLHDTRGIISIIGIAIFALLMIFGLMLQQTVVDTYQSVKGMNNYYIARDISDSTMEYLQYKLNNYEPGYNMEVECVYENCAYEGNCLVETIPPGPENEAVCGHLEDIISGEEVTLKMIIKGRAEEDEILASASRCGGGPLDSIRSDSCYIVPFPATGSAGDHCDLYYPDFFDDAAGDGDNDTDVSRFLTGGEEVDQLDYSCNWNKLMFGGSQMDRVSIPLYYDDGLGGIINPFATGAATRFYLRMRTPCLPCVYETGDVRGGINRWCERGGNKTVCDAGERYVLDDEGGYGDIVVQWQLTGQCVVDGGVEECGIVPIPDPYIDSAIFEGRINRNIREHRNDYSIVLRFDTEGYRTDIHENVQVRIDERLDVMERPTLTLFLNSALISEAGRNVPYLEYQIFTDSPIGNPKTKVNVIANVDGNAFWKILYKEEAKGLIDFAVQN